MSKADIAEVGRETLHFSPQALRWAEANGRAPDVTTVRKLHSDYIDWRRGNDDVVSLYNRNAEELQRMVEKARRNMERYERALALRNGR